MLKKFATDITHGLRSMVRGVDADWQFNERRRSLRFKCRHKIDLLVEEKEAEVKSIAYVLNYSMGGVRISNPGNLKVGDKVRLRFPHPLQGVTVKTISCQVIWKRKNTKSLEVLAGLKYLESGDRMSNSWISYFFRERQASPNDLKEDRKFFRAECKLDVVARSNEDRSVGEVHNIGLGGAFLRINRPAETGDQWGLDISGPSTLAAIHLKGNVLSCQMDESGMYAQRIQFDDIDDDTMKMLRTYILTLSKDFWSD